MPRYKKVLYAISTLLILFVIISIVSYDAPATETTSQSVAQEQTNSGPVTPKRSKEEVLKEIDDVMTMGKKAGIISSYDFTEIADNLYKGDVFVEKAWYDQKVTFKKDFVANAGMLKEELSGYSNIRFYDAYSNELVAEIDGFKGLQIYK